MNTTNPPSLRDIVAAGENPLDYETIGHLVDLLHAGTQVPVHGREREAATWRHFVDQMKRDGRLAVPVTDREPLTEEGDPVRFASTVRYFQWRAELFEDPSLVDQVVELLPPAERLAVSVEVDQSRSPHPLVVEPLEHWWSCDGCGATIEPGERALTIGYQPDYSEHDDIEALAWCLGCLREAGGELPS